MAAAQDGWHAETELMPQGEYAPDHLDDRPFATVRLRRDALTQPDPLFASVKARRTNRAVFDARAPEAQALESLRRAAQTPRITFHATTGRAQATRLAELAILGYRIEFGNARTWGESARLMRVGAPAVAKEPSGIALLGTEVWLGRELGLLAPASLARVDGIAARRAVDTSIHPANSTRAWAWLVSPDNSRRSQLESGRAYVRLSLQAAQSGLAVHPNSQVLQDGVNPLLFAGEAALFWGGVGLQRRLKDLKRAEPRPGLC